MDEFEIYHLLKEATGVRKFEKRHEEASNDIKKID
jgi:chromosome segregation ATPase